MLGSFRGGRVRALLLLNAPLVALGIVWAAPAHGTESGASLYVLGSGGPSAAIMPPAEGVFLNNIDATNRLEGEGYWLEFGMPLNVNMPAGAGA